MGFSFPSVINLSTLTTLVKSFSLNFTLLNVFNYDVSTHSSEVKSNNYNSTTGILNISMSANKDSLQMYTEGSSNQRITRFNTVFVNYDYKTGHYLGN
jgi:hypothetical protein